MTSSGLAIKILCPAIPLALASCSKPSTKADLAAIMKTHDPATATLEALDVHQRKTTLSDQTELGILTLGDGSHAKYWFRSHHLTKGSGGTWFLLDSGERIYMTGYFCCEVDIPATDLASPTSLKAFIAKNDGRQP